MTTEITRADYSNPKHAAEILYLLDIYSQDPMGGGKPLSQQVKENLITELKKRDYALSFIAYVGGEPAGLINCFEGFSSFACKPLLNIHDVMVVEKFRSQGISQLMINEVEIIAKQKGCCKLTLEVLEGNTPAKNAYSKQGFAGYELDPKMGKALFWEKPL